MSTLFLHHQIGILVFVVAVLSIAISNKWFLHRMALYPLQQFEPRVSILIPARNEEDNIGPCVRSLLAQDYGNMQVLVLNDESQDRTGQILFDLAAVDDRLLVANGSPLPEGWLGKNWACHQLVQLADGDLFLFVDADTRHSRGTVRSAVAALEAERADLLSAIPREEVVTWMERLVVPVIPWSIYSLLPVGLAHRFRSPWLSAAIGQFMLFRRSAYFQIGGHNSVRACFVDDLALARRVKAAGLRWRLVDGVSQVSCRMYQNHRDVVRGVSRTLYSVFEKRLALHVFAWGWLTIVFVEPPTVLAAWLVGAAVPPRSVYVASATAVISLGIWIWSYHRLGIPLKLALAYPISIALVALFAVRSALVTMSGKVSWKGRHIPATR
ncbi:MAG: glycosyltransferase [Caldilineaceae bacterium]